MNKLINSKNPQDVLLGLQIAMKEKSLSWIDWKNNGGDDGRSAFTEDGNAGGPKQYIRKTTIGEYTYYLWWGEYIIMRRMPNNRVSKFEGANSHGIFNIVEI